MEFFKGSYILNENKQKKIPTCKNTPNKKDNVRIFGKQDAFFLLIS